MGIFYAEEGCCCICGLPTEGDETCECWLPPEQMTEFFDEHSQCKAKIAELESELNRLKNER